MRLILVVAMAQNRVIGRDNGLPWHLPEDLKHFKAKTMGLPMIMGRKTWESIGRPLPGRTSIVVSRSTVLEPVDGMLPVADIDSAIRAAEGLVGADGDCAVVGGAEIYRQTLPLADVIELTLIEQDVVGDTEFPAYDQSEWDSLVGEQNLAAHDSTMQYRFVTMTRKRN